MSIRQGGQIQMRASGGLQAGFNLIEMMVVVALIGILAAIAYPTYTNAMVKGNRAAAQGFLLEVSQKQQQYFLDNRGYASSLSDLGLSAPDDVNKFYTVSVTLAAGPPPGFTISAAPKTATRQAGDGTLSIDHTGNRLPADKW